MDNLTAIKRDDITFRELGKKLREIKERIEDTCIRMTNGLRRIYDSFKITLSSTIKIGIYYPLFSYFITRSSKEPIPRIYVLNLRFEKSGKIEEKKKRKKKIWRECYRGGKSMNARAQRRQIGAIMRRLQQRKWVHERKTKAHPRVRSPATLAPARTTRLE